MNLHFAGSHSYSPRSVMDIFTGAALAVAMIVPSISVLANDETPPPTVEITPAENKPIAVPKDGLTHSPKADEPAVIKIPVKPIVMNFTALPPDWSTLTQTKASSLFRDIERRVNSNNPSFPIVILDDDSINLRDTENDPTFRNRMYEILNDRGIKLRWHFKSEAAEGLGGLKGPTARDPRAIRVKLDDYGKSEIPGDRDIEQKAVCLVIPPVADVSSRTLLERWVGKAGPNYMEAKLDPGPYAMVLRSTWHEVWHCTDTEFYLDNYTIPGETALNNAHRMHMSETFADVAATLTMTMLGYPRIAQDMADIRAVSSYWNGRKSMRGVRPTDEAYYEGVTYYVTRAQDLMDKHIRDAGHEAVTRYTLDDVRRIARDITLQGALTKEEFKNMADAYARSDAPSERVKLARNRILEDSGRPILPGRGRTDEEHYDVADRLRDMPQTEKDSISQLVKARADQAVIRGQRREQGVIDLIDEWRRELHESSDRKPEIERQLYVLSLMLSYGQLEKELARERVKRKADTIEPKPETPHPTPEPVTTPDFTPKFKWEVAPPNQA